MKTDVVTRNIALSRDLDEYAQAQAELAGCNTLSEWFRELVRRYRQQQADEDVALLERCMAGAPMLTDADVAKVLAAQKKVRRRRR